MLTIDWLHGLTRVWRVAMWGCFGALLLAPLTAMQFTREVQWTAFDFAAATALLVTLGLSVELAVRAPTRLWIRTTAIATCAGAALLAWAHGAVGVF